MADNIHVPEPEGAIPFSDYDDEVSADAQRVFLATHDRNRSTGLFGAAAGPAAAAFRSVRSVRPTDAQTHAAPGRGAEASATTQTNRTRADKDLVSAHGEA